MDQQPEAEGHVMPNRRFCSALVFGDDTISHDVPPQCSTRVRLFDCPTAQQLNCEGQVTDLKLLSDPGFGEETVDQTCPSHFSMRVRTIPKPVAVSPTAQHSCGDTHVTLKRLSEPLGLSESTIVHDEPSQRATSVRPAPSTSSYPPTAQQFVFEEQVTPTRTSIGGLDSPRLGESIRRQAFPSQCSMRVR